MDTSAQDNDYSTLNKEENEAINCLRVDQTIVNEQADKGSKVVLYDFEVHSKFLVWQHLEEKLKDLYHPLMGHMIL